jgi:predicted dithiol-disulfide oxidoreductase (DUF899 family)
MTYKATAEKLAAYRKEITALRKKMREAQAAVEPEPVKDYELATTSGPVRLSALFGGKDTLIVIHNMGRSCPSCTMWADGFNGVYDHLASRAAFVVSSPDAPETQRQFAQSRNWKFPMVSHQGTTFAADMGYHRDGGFCPGVSVFRRRDDGIVRVSDSAFNENDDFCNVWRLFDLLPEGAAGWKPKYTYAADELAKAG